MHSAGLESFSHLSAGTVLEIYELCNSCVINCQDHSGSAAAARAQAWLLDTYPMSFSLRSQSYSFGPGQAEKELPLELS